MPLSQYAVAIPAGFVPIRRRELARHSCRTAEEAQQLLSLLLQPGMQKLSVIALDQRGCVLEMHGYFSGAGQAAIASSRRMADSVVRYLVLNHEIPAYPIYVVGMGNASLTAGEGATSKRTSRNRVEISVLKNNLDQLASTPSSGANAPPK